MIPFQYSKLLINSTKLERIYQQSAHIDIFFLLSKGHNIAKSTAEQEYCISKTFSQYKKGVVLYKLHCETLAKPAHSHTDGHINTSGLYTPPTLTIVSTACSQGQCGQRMWVQNHVQHSPYTHC